MPRTDIRTIALLNCHPLEPGSLFLLSALLITMLSLLQPLAIEAQEEVPINSGWVGDRVFVTWGCEHFQGTNMAVVHPLSRPASVPADTRASPRAEAR